MFPDHFGQKLPVEYINKSVPPIRFNFERVKELESEAIIHGETIFNIELLSRENDLFFHGSSNKNCPVLKDIYDKNKKIKKNKEFLKFIENNFKQKFINIINKYSE